MSLTFSVYDINEAFDTFRHLDLSKISIKKSSRNGDVYKIPGIVTVEYKKPYNRVLFNTGRDCNHFFHLYESMWMLNGNNDVDSLTVFNKRMKEYSDDELTLNGAYGYRWRYYFGYDQIQFIIDELKNNQNSRRCVLQMWDGGNTDDMGVWFEGSGDLSQAINGSKDVPCNLCCVFDVEDYKLNMTVFNRSNDIVWGMLGANAVHFSYLHEYISCAVSLAQGSYYQVSSNCHAYLSTWNPSKWNYIQDITRYDEKPPVSLFNTPSEKSLFLDELSEIVSDPFSNKFFVNDFLRCVASPMFKAFNRHLHREYEEAYKTMQMIKDPHWRLAGLTWLKKRHDSFISKV